MSTTEITSLLDRLPEFRVESNRRLSASGNSTGRLEIFFVHGVRTYERYVLWCDGGPRDMPKLAEVEIDAGGFGRGFYRHTALNVAQVCSMVKMLNVADSLNDAPEAAA